MLYDLDDIDKKIIEILQRDSRTSFAEIARQTNLSRVAVRDRVNQLVNRNIIEEFSVIINANSLGYSISAFLDIRVEPSKLEEVAATLARDEYVFVVYQMTGSTSLHVHAYLKDSAHLSEFMKTRIYNIPGILEVHSSILLTRYKSRLNIR